MILHLGLNNQVVFLNPVANQIMPSYYSSAQLTVIPTIRREGTSLSALESMACKTATVSTDIGGLLDLPTMKAKTDPIDLAQKMELALQQRKKIASQQHQDVLNVFNLENWGKAWLNVIDLVSKNTKTS